MLWVSDPWLVTLFLEQFVLTIFRTADGLAGVFKYKVLPALTLQSLPPSCRHSVLSLKLRTCIVLISMFVLQLSKSLSCEQLPSDNMCCCIYSYMHTHRRSVLPRILYFDVRKICLGVPVICCPHEVVSQNCILSMDAFSSSVHARMCRYGARNRARSRSFVFFPSPNFSYSLWGPPSFGWAPWALSQEAGE